MLPRVKRIAHIVLYVRDPEVSAKWYCDVLGMEIVTRVKDGPYAGGLFLTFGASDHDIALFRADPNASHGREFEHIGLELDCFGDVDQLRRMHDHFRAKGVKVHEILDHGVSIGVYFYDPDGHMLEVFVPLIAQEGRVSLEELRRNGGQADPIELSPMGK